VTDGRNGGADRPEIVDLRALLERPGPGSHRVTQDIGGTPVPTLADLPPARGGLLFVGLNPSPVSVTAGHYHQGSLGRRFWGRLGQAGILPPTTPTESADDTLVAAGHGITDLLKLPTPRDTASDADLRAGVGPLWQKIAIWRPAAVVFIYKRGAEIVAGRPIAEPSGHLVGIALAGRPCFLMPGPYAPAGEVRAGLNLLRNLVASLPTD
jgi:TDG/mug DNA glycosylase family protein